MTSETYADFGVRTIQGAYWMLIIMAVLAANTVVFYGVRARGLSRGIRRHVGAGRHDRNAPGAEAPRDAGEERGDHVRVRARCSSRFSAWSR